MCAGYSPNWSKPLCNARSPPTLKRIRSFRVQVVFERRTADRKASKGSVEGLKDAKKQAGK